MTERNLKFYSFKGLQRKARQKSGPDREVRAETTLRVEETSWKYGNVIGAAQGNNGRIRNYPNDLARDKRI